MSSFNPGSLSKMREHPKPQPHVTSKWGTIKRKSKNGVEYEYPIRLMVPSDKFK